MDEPDGQPCWTRNHFRGVFGACRRTRARQTAKPGSLDAYGPGGSAAGIGKSVEPLLTIVGIYLGDSIASDKRIEGLLLVFEWMSARDEFFAQHPY